MSHASDAALPWVLLFGVIAAGVVGGVLAVGVDWFIRRGIAWLAGRLSGLPILVAPYDCDECPAKEGEPHRYAGCPGNVRQHEHELARETPMGGD